MMALLDLTHFQREKSALSVFVGYSIHGIVLVYLPKISILAASA